MDDADHAISAGLHVTTRGHCGTKCNGDIMNGDTKKQVGDTMLRVWGHNVTGDTMNGDTM